FISMEHLSGKRPAPVMFFQDFSHELIDICSLHVKIPLVKIRYRHTCLPCKQYIMLVVFSMADRSFPQAVLPHLLVAGTGKSLLRFLPMAEKKGDTVEKKLLKVIFSPL